MTNLFFPLLPAKKFKGQPNNLDRTMSLFSRPSNQLGALKMIQSLQFTLPALKPLETVYLFAQMLCSRLGVRALK